MADLAVGAVPAWSDLPHVAGIVARAYGSPLGRMPLVGGVWRATAGSFWLLLLAAAHVRGRVRATTHAVVIVDKPSPLTRSELGLLTAIMGAMVLAVVGYQAGVVALLTAMGAGSRWINWAPPSVLVIMLSMLVLETAPACRRATRDWGRTTRLGRELRAAGESVATAGMLAAWPRGQGHAGELMRMLIAEADRVGVDIVIGAANVDLAATYGRYGWRPWGAEDRLLLVRVASQSSPAAEELQPGARELQCPGDRQRSPEP